MSGVANGDSVSDTSVKAVASELNADLVDDGLNLIPGREKMMNNVKSRTELMEEIGE